MTSMPRAAVAGMLSLLGCAFSSPPVMAQTSTHATTQTSLSLADTSTRPKVGLVLSGGGAKGFAHIGVIEVLERAGVPIDVISGTSMGSIVGGLYAIGYTPAMLRRVAETENWSADLSRSTSRNDSASSRTLSDGHFLLSVPLREGAVAIPPSLLGSQHISMMLSRLVWTADTVRHFRDFAIPFVAVATDLATGEAVPLTAGPLSMAMRASMSLPGVLTPTTIDDHRLIDGGIARNLPARDAIALGADILICVDVSNPLESADSLTSAFDILMQVVTFRMQASTEAERARCSVLITPDIRGFNAATFDRGSDWIARGIEATTASLTAVRDTLRSHGIPLRTAEWAHQRVAHSRAPIGIRRMEVRGDARGERTLLTRFGISSKSPSLDATDVERRTDRLYATGRYAVVTSQLVSTGDTTDVVFTVSPSNPNSISLGLRYDSRYKASLLFGADIHDRLMKGSATTLEVRVGEQSMVKAQFQPTPYDDRLLVRSITAKYSRLPLDVFEKDLQTGQSDVRNASVSGFLGAVVRTTMQAGIQLTGEWGRTSAAISPVDVAAVHQTFYTVSAVSWTDTFDRATFATRGVSLYTAYEVADNRIGSGASFARAVLDGEMRWPIADGTTVIAHVAAGDARGKDLPFYKHFFLGGAFPSPMLQGTEYAFPSLDTQERSGGALQLAETGVQQLLPRDLFLTVRASVGNTFKRWPGVESLDAYVVGMSASLGMQSLLGPVNIMAGFRRWNAPPRFSLEVGHRF